MVFDYLIIGGGIVGLSTAYAISNKYPDARIIILEKEDKVAAHQTGHNSGVIHSGIYYRPGSLKARFAREGGQKLRTFCREHEIHFENCGKVIVAVKQEEVPLLDNLYHRGLENRLQLELFNPAQVHDIEPHAFCLKAIHVPSTGIVDYKQVSLALADTVRERGGRLRLHSQVRKIYEKTDGITVECDDASFSAHFLINCAGLHCDQVALMQGIHPGMRIIPFRGEYYEIKPEKRHLVRNLIYPVPNPKFPFLGVHFTRMVDGRVLAGPNAVLGLKREGYRKRDFNLNDFIGSATYFPLWKIAASNLGYGLGEMMRSFSKKRFVASMRTMIPEISEADVVRSQAGVRAQAVTDKGELADDFLMIERSHALHILNAPSPAATASFSIGEAICDKLPEPSRLMTLS
ncbi:L-2-hydroxyglutarate oxidase [Sporolactobacillus vineae]|uniref:L-2-hydroxyglutarate oxidase n=1 Tax=Sporolactobacillus vineae TaxID=444463 RepID=UPI0002894F8A|nr:L-2-hydroxyglutarate oxidase [Sporolactobacillus vineae]